MIIFPVSFRKPGGAESGKENDMDESPFVRAFVALSISEEVRAALSALQDQARRFRVRVGWVLPENIHITLAFLGQVPREALPGIQTALDEAVLPLAPFVFEACGVGWFGGRRPRVLWAGVSAGAEAVCRAAAAVHASVRKVGYPDDARDLFTPHMTLGRLRPGSDPAVLMDFLHKRHAATPFGRSESSGVLLMESRLASNGTSYAVLHESRFGGTPAP